MMKWPTTTVEVAEYPGFQVTLRDLAVSEVENLEEALTNVDMGLISRFLSTVIVDWTAATPDGEVVPATAEGMKQLPAPLLQRVLLETLKYANREILDPKVPSITNS